MTKHNSLQSAAELAAHIRPNIFPAAWPAVRNWGELNWDRHAYQRNSSQALAVDVFGTLQLAPDRHQVLDAVAGALGLPAGGSWSVELEAQDPTNALNEAMPTPADALLRSPELLLIVECKFTERHAGECKQVQPRKTQPAPCTGDYAFQVNSANVFGSRCALEAKGARYWDWIPRVFTFQADQDYLPCPFRGSWYQWMRLMTVGAAIAKHENRQPAFLLVYADRKGLPMAHTDWTALGATLRQDTMPFYTLSYQRLLTLASAASPSPLWPELQRWVEQKIAVA
jgi:hypothetical protein